MANWIWILRLNPPMFLHNSVGLLRCTQSHSEWFNVKWFTVEKRIHSALFTVVVMDGHDVYNINIATCMTFLYADNDEMVVNLKKNNLWGLFLFYNDLHVQLYAKV